MCQKTSQHSVSGEVTGRSTVDQELEVHRESRLKCTSISPPELFLDVFIILYSFTSSFLSCLVSFFHSALVFVKHTHGRQCCRHYHMVCAAMEFMNGSPQL